LCVDPKCALGAICTSSNHREECSCRPPLKGDGYSSCTERKQSLFCYISLCFFGVGQK
jgi:hypothetical protein